MTKSDWKAILVIGGGVGLLIQPILTNNLPNYHLGIVERVGVFAFFLLFAPLALFIARLIARWIPPVYQFAQFAAVGTLNSFIDVGVFNLETFFYGSSFIGNVLFATFKAISFLFATTNSFIWNKYWTFGSKDKADAKQVSSFYGVAAVGWAVNVTAATIVKILGPAGSKSWVNIVAPLGGVAASFIWNFLGYKYWVFKKKPAQT